MLADMVKDYLGLEAVQAELASAADGRQPPMTEWMAAAGHHGDIKCVLWGWGGNGLPPMRYPPCCAAWGQMW